MSTLKVDTLQNAVGENFVFNNKNLIINGDMKIWQRGTQETNIDSGGYYTVDRINTTGNLTAGTGEFTQERSTDVPTAQGFKYSLKMDCTTSDTLSTTSGFMTVRQRIEGQNLQHLLKGSSSAKKVTLSFWVKSSKTGTYICQLFDEDNTRSISKSYSVSSANTWEKKELTFDGDTTGAFDNDVNRSLHVVWWLAAGTDYTSGSLGTSWSGGTDGNGLGNFVATGQVNLADSTSNEFYLTGLQLETGSVATDFEFEPYQTTLIKCQRYYEKSYDDDVAPGTANVSGQHYDGVGGQLYPRTFVYFKVRKRTDQYTWTDYQYAATNTTGVSLWENGTTHNVSSSNLIKGYSGIGVEANKPGPATLNARTGFHFQWTVENEL